MLKIESNLKINGRHWGLAFVDGIAYTANVSLAAKLRQKGYVVTDQQPAAEHINTKHEFTPTPPSPAQADTNKTVAQPEAVPIPAKATEPIPETVQTAAILLEETTTANAAETPTPKATKPRKKVVTLDAVDEH